MPQRDDTANSATRRWATGGFIVAALLLYTYGVLSVGYIPKQAVAIALPLDFMVGIPSAFYIVVIRPRRMTLLAILPVIWLGYGLSVLALGSADAGILPVLLSILLPVEVAVAVGEARIIVKTFMAAKTDSTDPMEWFFEVAKYLVRKETPARMMAAELSVWYYSVFSWRKKPYAASGEKAYSYHNAGGYMNMIYGLALAFPVEIIGVHMLVFQWSAAAAVAVTLLSVYAAVWLLGDARARVLRPIVVNADEVSLRCGIQMTARIPIDSIEYVSASEPKDCGLKDCKSKGRGPEECKTRGLKKLNYGTFYQANVWIVAKHPIEVRTILGTRQVSVIGISLDDPQRFISDINAKLRGESN